MTHKRLKASIEMIINLVENANALINEVQKNLELNDGILDMFDSIRVGEYTDVDNIIKELETSQTFSFDVPGVYYAPVLLHIDPKFPSDVSISRKVRGGTLISYLGEEDTESVQAGVSFKIPNNQEWDITMVKQTGGDLAVERGLDVNNQNFDILIYGDAFSEDNTLEKTILYKDMAHVVLSDLVAEYCGEYELGCNCISHDELDKIASGFSTTNRSDFKDVIKRKLEQIKNQQIVNAMAEWMVNVEKDESKWLSEENSDINDYIEWVYSRVCSEDKSRREWWKDFGLLDYQLDNIATEFDITWTDTLDADKQIYLVQTTASDGEKGASLMNQYQLCDYINMSDCHGESYDIWDVTIPGMTRHCHYKGWQPGCLIEVIRDDDNKLVVSLFGEDH